MSSEKAVDLNYLYDNAEDSDSEDDSDFVPQQSDSESEGELEEEEEGDENKASGSGSSSNVNKRALDNSGLETEHSDKKAKIDAIWKEMNNTEVVTNDVKGKGKAKEKEEEKEEKEDEEDVKEESAVEDKKKRKPLVRPKSSLSSLISQYNIKVPKMNTLEKSRLDWQGYVDREGIKDDLKYKNKDGYMEKVAFLQRVDDRRLNQLKSGKKEASGSKKC